MLKARFGADLDLAIRRTLPFVTRLRVPPDTLSICGVVVAGLAGAAFAGQYVILAGLALVAAGFLDLIDGVVARAQGSASRAGAFLDSTLDRVSDLLVYAGLGLGMARAGDVPGVGLVFAALIGSVLTSYAKARAEVEIPELSVGWMERAERWIVLILGAVSGFLHASLLVIAIGAGITSLQRIAVGRRLIAEAEAGDGEGSS